MAKYAIIKDGVVVNAAEADEQFAQAQGWVLLTDNAGIGWGWDGTDFVEPPAPESPQQTQPE